MPDPRGKLPGGLDTTDWDSLLSDLERKDEAPVSKPPPAAPKSTKSEVPPASVRGSAQPLYAPPSTPQPPRSSRPLPSTLPLDDMEEERTVVGVISRDLIEEAARGAGGLGQLFGKPDSGRRNEPDAIDISFEESGRHQAAAPLPSDDDPGVMTSAPALHVGADDAHDRVTPVPAPPSRTAAPASSKSLPEVSLDFGSDAPEEIPDPFAPPRKASPPPLPPAAPRAAPPPLPVLDSDSNNDEPTRITQVSAEALREAAQGADSKRAPLGKTPAPAPVAVAAPPPSAETTPIPGVSEPAAPSAAEKTPLPVSDKAPASAEKVPAPVDSAPASADKAPASAGKAPAPSEKVPSEKTPAAKAPEAARTPGPPRVSATPPPPRTAPGRPPALPKAAPRAEDTVARQSTPELVESSGPPSIEMGPLSTGEHAIAATRPQVDLSDERDAMAFLADVDALQDWSDRADWMEAEARAREDKTDQARTLLVVSEMLAMVGEEERAQALAEEARGLAPTLPLAHRQTRARVARERGFEALLEPLEVEARASTTAVGKAHALILAAEVLRLVSKDTDGALKKLEQAARLLPSDPRPHLLRVAVELSQGNKATRYRWPDEATLAPLATAAASLGALRGAFDKATPPSSAAEAITRARAAFADNNITAAAEALATIDGSTDVGRAALWLASTLVAPRAATRAQALEWAARVAPHDQAARRQQALWSFEAGDATKATEALETEGVFPAPERAAARALLGIDPSSLESEVRALVSDEAQRPLASALASSLALSSPAEAGAPSLRAAAALGRGLAQGGEQAQQAISEAAAQAPDDVVAPLLRLDLNVAGGQGSDVAAALAAWPRGEDAPSDFDRDRSLAAAITHALAGSAESALQEIENARQADPLHEASMRLLAALSPERAASEIDRLAAEVEDPLRRTLLLLEAATRQGPSSEVYGALLRLAHETSPDLPLAASLGLESSRRANDQEGLLGWLRARLEGERDAGDLIREALALRSSAPERAAERINEALQTHEDDVVLRELAERVDPAHADASWRARRAPKAAAPARVVLAYRAALDQERALDHAGAANLAQMAAESGGGELSHLLRDRCDAAGPGAPRLAEIWMAIAREPHDATAEREAYERLANLDEVGRNDPAGALQWHRALLERDPSWLPSLRYLEHRLTSEGRDEELEPVLAAIAQATTGPTAAAHAQVAARLRLRHSAWDTTRDLAELAARLSPPGVWGLRQAQAHARLANDSEASRRVALALEARTSHAGERATLLLRAAEAAEQLGDATAAIEHLRAVLELTPGHLVALAHLAELLEQKGEPADAARALVAAARAFHQPAYQAPLWYRAAVLWLDKVNDPDQGVIALEAVAAIDVNLGDTFTRLRALYAERKEGNKLASLLQRRLETEESPEARVELEVALGRALTELGDRQEAKRALAAALDNNPDHLDALRAFVELCTAENDWESAEQALIRLGRLVNEPAEQAELYAQLGDIYRLHLPNYERAELAYQEVLRRVPDSATARERLVKLYALQGNKEKALEIQTALLAAATDPADKRRRTIELSQLHEETLGDVKKAEQILDGLRKEFPHETQVLRALAEFHTRHNHGPAVNVLLDRAAADARRALATGRFELHFFANLATVFELRGNHEAASTASGTVAALEGRPGDVAGIGLRGARPDLDDLLAPDVFTAPFRALLQRSAALLDAASVVDLKGLRATPLPPTSAAVEQQIQQLAASIGLADLQVYTAPTLASACLPAAFSPPTLVLGAALLSEQNESIRSFLVLRALKCLQAGVAVFCRTAPIDLWPLTAAFLQLHAPSWVPQGVDANKLKDFKARLQRVAPPSPAPDLTALATEVANGIGNRASTLQTSANSWGARTALLVTGDASIALDAIAWAAGQAAGAPSANPDRMKWIGRNAEARDLIVFSVSDAYSEARSR